MNRYFSWYEALHYRMTSQVIKESFLNGKEGQLENLTGIFQVIYL
jgi:hypothetical protein